MEYIDFTKKKIELHKEIENAIKNMMTEKGVTEIDLTQDEENYDAGWVIRRVENASELEEVQVAYIKLYGNSLSKLIFVYIRYEWTHVFHSGTNIRALARLLYRT